MSGTTEAPPEARTAGTDDLTYGQLAAARKAAPGTCWTPECWNQPSTPP